jgi:hypothetical protein
MLAALSSEQENKEPRRLVGVTRALDRPSPYTGGLGVGASGRD